MQGQASSLHLVRVREALALLKCTVAPVGALMSRIPPWRFSRTVEMQHQGKWWRSGMVGVGWWLDFGSIHDPSSHPAFNTHDPGGFQLPAITNDYFGEIDVLYKFLSSLCLMTVSPNHQVFCLWNILPLNFM